ncbi:MAG: hypothetical protein HKO77_00190 [Gemmatimonadetes bacterium]|nr:hypothetical protein [Gemmatimonadota bacterium]
MGRSLAFAPDSGRLWAICTECGEWNLAPIEDRWDAVAECDRIFEETRERGSTGELTLARREGFDLLRVGTQAELPTLRYGARLRRRHAQYMRRKRAAKLMTAFALVGVVVGFALGYAALIGIGFVLVITLLASGVLKSPPVARVPTPDGGWTDMTRRELLDMRLVPTEPHGWQLRIRRKQTLEGPDAFEAARLTLPLLTRSATPKEDLRKALAYIGKKGGTAVSVFHAAARRRGVNRTARVSKLEVHIRLALEMLASREVEERAVADDLAHLQTAWRHAEELAAIQDDVTFDLSVWGRLRREG